MLCLSYNVPSFTGICLYFLYQIYINISENLENRVFKNIRKFKIHVLDSTQLSR